VVRRAATAGALARAVVAVALAVAAVARAVEMELAAPNREASGEWVLVESGSAPLGWVPAQA
jgi:hydrogenase maturation factor